MIVPGSSSPLLLASSAGYQIANSLRFRASNSAYLNRTPASAGNRKTWTWSAWVKRGALSGAVSMNLFVADRSGTTDAAYTDIVFTTTNQIAVRGYATNWRVSNAVFRDPSAWYHVVVALDTTQATAGDRVKVYVNGSQITSFATSNNPALNDDLGVNRAALHSLGQDVSGGPTFFDGHMAHVYLIDGHALTPSSFGQTDATTGVWVPKAYSGTFGTNGFFLQFKDAASTTTIGYDTSGNSNNFTTSGISVTAGTTFDQMLDTPTTNYATWNPLSSQSSFADSGNMRTSGGVYGDASVWLSSGKWYGELTIETMTTWVNFGVGGVGWNPRAPSVLGNTADSYALELETTNNYIRNNSGVVAAGLGGGAAGVVLMCAIDMDANRVWLGRNGTWYNSGNPAAGTNPTYTSLPATLRLGNTSAGAGGRYWLNCGQRAFAYTPPTGFKALSTANITSTAVTTSGSFTGNAAADGPFVWTNGNPATLTINGNAVTFGTHADKTAGGFKLRSSSSSYNASGSNTWTATAGKRFVQSKKPNNAQTN